MLLPFLLLPISHDTPSEVIGEQMAWTEENTLLPSLLFPLPLCSFWRGSLAGQRYRSAIERWIKHVLN